ncbi:MAG: hypothetical protein HZB51_25595 [Chloroflexi bacterium]|nr:hypothetical protein [Chloroflexota bacterium]
MTTSVTVFLFIKATAESQIEKLVADAQCAVAVDTLEKLRSIPEIGEIIVATPSEEFAAHVESFGVQVETDRVDEDFHWGKTLASLVEKYRAHTPLYIGGGSGGLMSVDDWRAIAQRAANEARIVITNNYYSADFAAWSPGDAVNEIQPPSLDNDLAYRLGERAKLQVVPLNKNAATQLDIDTPNDLLTIGLHPAVGKHLRAFLDNAQLDLSRVTRTQALLANRTSQLLVAGRVSASMALFLERSTPCQWRIFSEERGMRASGRDERGLVRSLLGFHLETVGAEKFFDTLASLCDAAIIDSRVLFAHRHLRPAAPDRFYSDLLEPEPIRDPWIKGFTQAARDASIPILLGGHSLVSGGLYALAESKPKTD